MTGGKRRRVKWIVGLVLVALVAVGVARWYVTPRFDSATWKASNGRDHVRVNMVDDLMRRHDLIGMTDDQITDLLGPPRDTPYFREFDYVYLLGPERSFVGIDYEWLCLKTADGVVIDAKIMRD